LRIKNHLNLAAQKPNALVKFFFAISQQAKSVKTTHRACRSKRASAVRKVKAAKRRRNSLTLRERENSKQRRLK